MQFISNNALYAVARFSELCHVLLEIWLNSGKQGRFKESQHCTFEIFYTWLSMCHTATVFLLIKTTMTSTVNFV